MNKYNYVVASQDEEVRTKLRGIPGVPLLYVKRSIMILEPMAEASADVRGKEEGWLFEGREGKWERAGGGFGFNQ